MQKHKYWGNQSCRNTRRRSHNCDSLRHMEQKDMGSAYFEFFVEYLTSNWSVKFNAFLFLRSALFTHDAYAKNWSAKTAAMRY